MPRPASLALALALALAVPAVAAAQQPANMTVTESVFGQSIAMSYDPAGNGGSGSWVGSGTSGSIRIRITLDHYGSPTAVVRYSDGSSSTQVSSTEAAPKGPGFDLTATTRVVSDGDGSLLPLGMPVVLHFTGS